MDHLHRQGRAVRVLAILAFAALAGCKSGGTPDRDAGPKTDVPVEKTADAGDGGGVCTGALVGTATNGEACSCAGDCASGFCVDGVCCETACTGLCQSCGLPTSLGMCTATPAGVKPRLASQCGTEDKATCGLDGTCDGAGACRKYEEGTMCKTGSCDSDAVVGAYICDGAGKCKLGATTVCAPFSCNSGSSACFDKCSSDAECVAGRKCVDGSCGKKMNGAVCAVGDECASTFCADVVNGKGVCCNAACDGACRSCSLVASMGTCSPVAAGLGHPKCIKEATSTCGSTGVCDGFGGCSQYPSSTPCGAAMCTTATMVNTARTCDGLGTCESAATQDCGSYRCVNGGCNSRCTTNADCADGIACVNGSCGPRVDGQPCTMNSQCQNAHCVTDTAGGAGICCNTDCVGACRSCGLANSRGRCTLVTAGAADPRATCTDMTAATCGTDGRCDGAGACRRYPAGTVCAGEACANDVYTGPSSCNASGQCIKPNAAACFPYHCNANRCFTACTTSAQCITPNICGMNGMISSCGLKPLGATCSAANECSSNFCAQGVCCNNACNTACRACNLAGTVGSCSNINSGADPQGRCPAQAASTCGTTGQCAGGACARHASGTVCLGAACPTASTRRPPSTCNGTGTCVTPAVANCAPGRCDATTLTCVNSCSATVTNPVQCTAPAVCLNGSCGLITNGGGCTANNQCQSGQCYLAEGSPGVCCNNACSGTCESCRLAGTVGTCSAVPAGAADPDPASVCVAAANPMTCGLNGRCAGNNTATNAASTARCQSFGSTQGCRARSCTAGTATTPAMETAAASCNGAGACPAIATMSCGNYNKCNGVQCATSCTANTDCVSPITCNTQTGRCGEKLGPGAACGAATDCMSNNCVDGVCCNSACTGNCQVCNAAGSIGTCTNAPAMCNDGNACNGVETTCTAAGVCQAGTPPNLDDGNPCTVDACTPAGGVTHTPGNAGTVCRAANGVCDVAEACTGTSATCPVNGFLPETTMCRAAVAGGCDVAEMCTGDAAGCPSDAVVPAATVCRASAGVCDVAEVCTGSSPSCPPNAFLSTVCRAASGTCDVAESCNGSSAACPNDAVRPSTFVCRAAAAGGCDVAETCDGMDKECPSNAFAPASQVCRAAIPGGCDVAENCTGGAAACPGDAVNPSTVVCRPSMDAMCDPAENCTGSTPSCPNDAHADPGTACGTDMMCNTNGMCVGGPAVSN